LLRPARLGVLLAAALWLTGCATSSEPDPLQLQVEDMDSRLARIDRVVDSQGLVQMSQQLDSLQQQVRSLQGRIDELQNENETLRKQQRDLYADLESRLNGIAAASANAAAAAYSPGSGAADAQLAASASGDEQARYDAAFNALKNREYAAAVDGFRTLAAAYPNGALADNTQYWLGEAYYVTQEYDHAAATFQRVVTTWPDSRKAPDALLKLGYTQIEQKQVAAGKQTLQQVLSRYPDSDAAKLAAERLVTLPAG
jgi:tol-pal system protein YbgF